MRFNLLPLLQKLWKDDGGSIIATEYLALGSIVALGTAGGLASMRDAVNAEMEEYGTSVRSTNQSYRYSSQQNKIASKAGAATVDTAQTAPHCVP